jgi:hypothetical protein
VYFSAAYSESLFLLAMCGLFLAASEQRFGVAAAWGLAAGLTRPNGWLLALPLTVLLLQAAPRGLPLREWIRRGMAVAAPIAGVLLYTYYLHVRFSDGFAWLRGQEAWGRTYRSVQQFVADRLSYISEFGTSRYLTDRPIDAVNTFAAFLPLVLVIPIARRLGLAFGTLVAVLVLPQLLMGGATSMGRMTSVLFPMFIWLAAVLPARHRLALMIAFTMLQGLAAALFFTWRELY